MIKKVACSILLLSSMNVWAEVTGEKAWSRITAPSVPTGAVFLELKNSGPYNDSLIGVNTPVAKTVEIHNHINDKGIMRMREVRKIDIPAGRSVILEPGGYHLMLINLKSPLKLNQTFPINLLYQSGKSETVNVTVDNGANFKGHHNH